MEEAKQLIKNIENIYGRQNELRREVNKKYKNNLLNNVFNIVLDHMYKKNVMFLQGGGNIKLENRIYTIPKEKFLTPEQSFLLQRYNALNDTYFPWTTIYYGPSPRGEIIIPRIASFKTFKDFLAEIEGINTLPLNSFPLLEDQDEIPYSNFKKDQLTYSMMKDFTNEFKTLKNASASSKSFLENHDAFLYFQHPKAKKFNAWKEKLLMNYFDTESVNEEVFIMKRSLPYLASIFTQEMEQKIEDIERIKVKRKCEEEGKIYDRNTNTCREKMKRKKEVEEKKFKRKPKPKRRKKPYLSDTESDTDLDTESDDGLSDSDFGGGGKTYFDDGDKIDEGIETTRQHEKDYNGLWKITEIIIPTTEMKDLYSTAFKYGNESNIEFILDYDCICEKDDKKITISVDYLRPLTMYDYLQQKQNAGEDVKNILNNSVPHNNNENKEYDEYGTFVEKNKDGTYKMTRAGKFKVNKKRRQIKNIPQFCVCCLRIKTNKEGEENFTFLTSRGYLPRCKPCRKRNT